MERNGPFKLSKSSEARLITCHISLQDIVYDLLKEIDIVVIKGTRTEAEQTEAYRAGNSKVQYPNSKHNSYPSQAVDIAPWKVDKNGNGHIPWKDEKAFEDMAARFLRIAGKWGVPIRWGGDWDGDGDRTDQTFNDLVHFEIDESKEMRF